MAREAQDAYDAAEAPHWNNFTKARDAALGSYVENVKRAMAKLGDFKVRPNDPTESPAREISFACCAGIMSRVRNMERERDKAAGAVDIFS